MFKLYTRPMFTQLVFVPSLVQIRTEKDAKEDNVENLSVTQTRVIRLQIVIKLEANGSCSLATMFRAGPDTRETFQA